MASDISGTQYSVKRKQLLALVNELQNAGAQDDLDLPRIAVIGSQSAGKSSVVESISGITVPRDAGTCTRAPIECLMVNSPAPWSCNISIRREPNAKNGLTQPVIIRFGDTIHEKSRVEPTLRRAQVAALDPTLDISKSLSCSDEVLEEYAKAAIKKTPFTQDVVCLDLRGPECVDLAFIDLPGLIQNAEPDIVKLVEDIVTSHIKGRCLILVALPMTDDIENQRSLRLAHAVDPEKERTIGVLTKPDMLGTGNKNALDNWVRVLEGKTHPLVHGYFCTRQPNDEERVKARSNQGKAREIEEKFFRETQPWNKTSSQDRLGVSNLVKTLGELLVNLIQESLPKIMALAQEQSAHCRHSLRLLPPPLLREGEEPTSCLLRLITEYAADIRECVRGTTLFDLFFTPENHLAVNSDPLQGPNAPRLIQKNRVAYLKLKDQIRSTAPRFVPWEDGKSKKKEFLNSLQDGDEEREEVVRLRKLAEGEMFTLTKMREHIRSSITRELPNNVPFSAKSALITAFQASWPTYTFSCLEQVKHDVINLLHERVEHRFGSYALLKTIINSHLTELVRTHYDICRALLDIELEKERTPFTQNGHYLESSTEKWLAKYKDSREASPSAQIATNSFNFATPPFSTSTSQNGFAKFAQPTSFESNGFPQKATIFSQSSTTATGTPVLNGQMSKSLADLEAKAAEFLPSQSTRNIFAKPNEEQQKFASTGQTKTSSASVFGVKSATAVAIPSFPSAAEFAPVVPSTTDFTVAQQQPKEKVPHDEKLVSEALAALAKIGYAGLTAEDLGKLNPVDQFETELRVMAEVRGYFQVSYKRIIDNVPNDIDLKFVRAISGEVQSFLISKLALGTDCANAAMKDYLADDPSVAEKRKQLLAKQARLDLVFQKLEAFGMQSN